MPDAVYVSSAQVAEALGVGVSTIKRWVDDGILPAHRTAGGHRKLLLSDVMRLVHDHDFPRLNLGLLQAARPTGVDSTDLPNIAAQFATALLDGDGDLATSLIVNSYRMGVAVDRLADFVIAPALKKIGHEWQENRIDVMHEHRATQICMASLFELKARLEYQALPDRPVAVGGAPEQNQHGLSSLLATLVLLDAGWEVVNLGPNTPLSSFRTALTELGPRLLWLSVNYLTEVESFLSEYAELFKQASRLGIPVAVGGRALTEEIRRRMAYTTFGDGMMQLAAFARSLHPLPRRKPRGRPPRQKS